MSRENLELAKRLHAMALAGDIDAALIADDLVLPEIHGPLDKPGVFHGREAALYPADERGAFCPMPGPAWWHLWRSAAGCSYVPGDTREAACIERWQRSGGAWEWELRGRPWARSDWERDGSPWTRALAELGHPNWRLSE